MRGSHTGNYLISDICRTQQTEQLHDVLHILLKVLNMVAMQGLNIVVSENY